MSVPFQRAGPIPFFGEHHDIPWGQWAADMFGPPNLSLNMNGQRHVTSAIILKLGPIRHPETLPHPGTACHACNG